MSQLRLAAVEEFKKQGQTTRETECLVRMDGLISSAENSALSGLGVSSDAADGRGTYGVTRMRWKPSDLAQNGLII